MARPDPPATHTSEVNIHKIPVAISSCLLGNKVRYDGGHKYHTVINETLNAFFSFVPVCPEVGIGLGTPRPPIHLLWSNNRVRARGVQDTALDVTQQLMDYADQQHQLLRNVSGYILKSRSPSCAMQGVEVAHATTPGHTSSGIYAGQLMRLATLLPFEEEDRLDDPDVRDNFIERVLVYDRLHCLLMSPELNQLAEFHSQHRLTIMSHDPDALVKLEKLVARVTDANLNANLHDYASLLMQAMRRTPTRQQHVKVMQSIIQNLPVSLTSDVKRNLQESIANYQDGRCELSEPRDLLQHHLRNTPDAILSQSHYLQSCHEQLAQRRPN